MLNAHDTRVTRRRFGRTAGGALASVVFRELAVGAAPGASGGRLTARPSARAVTVLESGPLGLVNGGRDGALQVPAAAAERKVPLLVFLHGATQSGADILRAIGPAAAAAGVAVLAPDSRHRTWDAIHGTFGEDLAFVNLALEHVFERLAVDPARVAIGGFSDGATYALSLGVANGDLFRRVVAFSPGFLIDAPAHRRPRVFVSHGTLDPVFRIDRCSRTIVRRLRSAGYDVTFREFDGRHEMPPAVANEGVQWMTSA